MKFSEFRRWLKSKGVVIEKGSRHDKLYFQEKRSTLGRHKGKEIPEGTRKAILKQLGIDD